LIQVPRRRPSDVQEYRFALGDYERQQLNDFKIISLAPAVGILGAGLAIGAGLGFGLWAMGRGLEEIDEWVSSRWETWFGMDQQEVARVENAINDTPADFVGGSMPGAEIDGAPDYGGMSPAAIYNDLAQKRSTVQLRNYRAWVGMQNGVDRPAMWAFWLKHATGMCGEWIQMSTDKGSDPELAESMSQFTYQLIIRETAARRLAGFAASTAVGGVLSGAGGVIASTVTWGVMNALGDYGGKWTSSDVREAPGFYPDYLLTGGWSRTDFPGVDAPQQTGAHLTALFNVSSSLTYENEVIDQWIEWEGSSPSNPKRMDEWPPRYDPNLA